MKALLLDIGNTRLKWGLFDGNTIGSTGNIAMHTIHERGITVLHSKLPRNIDTVIGCNVGGADFARKLSAFIDARDGHRVQYLRPEASAFGVTNSYRQPHRLGADRWAAMIGARSLCDTDCIVVDAGTAITVDVLDADGRHLGGQIMPGLRLMTESLADFTKALPRIKRRPAVRNVGLGIFADSSKDAILQGVASAAIGALDRAIRVLLDAGYEPEIFMTGGDAAEILSSLEREARHCPDLVLQGLAKAVN